MSDDVFQALAHPHRRQMLEVLLHGPQPVHTLSGHFEMSRPAVSQHLKVLLEAGLVQEARVGRERHYTLEPTRLREVHDWLLHFQMFWEGGLKRLGQHLEQNP